MMWGKVSCALVLIGTVSAAFVKDLGVFDGLDRLTELPCLTIRGTCANADSCPAGTRVAMKGLCPQQQEDGVECCVRESKVKSLQTKCQQRGGSCMASDFKCPNYLTIREATDCGKDEICCVFVH